MMVVGCRLSVVGCPLSVVSCPLSAVCCRFSDAEADDEALVVLEHRYPLGVNQRSAAVEPTTKEKIGDRAYCLMNSPLVTVLLMFNERSSRRTVTSIVSPG